ncbi:MAG: outer membrane protein assembly factor BamD [Deltaproteobacteria bacterium]|nr:MAG: outer membrane protein assembly factor BamD [Deltaproteobacteria bacterium]
MLWWLMFTVGAQAAEPWADALKVGDCAAVLGAIDAPESDVERLGAGWCALRRDRAAEGLAWLEAVDGPLSPYATLARGEALLALDRPDEAMTVLEKLDLPGPTGQYARLVYGRAGIAAKRSLDVRETLRDLLNSEHAHEARYLLAVGGEQRGAKEAAIATYRRVWADSTRGGWAEKAAERLAALGQPVPDLATAEGRALAQERAAALSKDHQHGSSLELRRELSVDEPPKTDASKLALARATFKGRDYKAANRLYAQALGAPDKATGAARDLFDYALGTARTGDYATSSVIYRRLMEQHPTDPRADTASYKIGYMAWDERRCEDAVTELTRHIAAWPDSKHLDEALWFQASCQQRLGRIDDARTAWKRLVEQRERSSLVAGAAYWIAKTEPDEAVRKSALEGVVSRYPVSGYAWFAAEQLGTRFKSHARVDRPAWPGELARREDVQRAELLLDAGFADWARAELATALPSATSRDAALAAAHALIAAGDYRTAKKLAAPYCVSPWKDGDPVAQQACTPMPEATVVAAVAKRYELPGLLPFGIMTSESALDPSVTSIAGARGLMQLMPEEADRIHAELYAWDYDPDDLYMAPYNASLGTAELGMKQQALGDLLDGTDLPAVIASYNGGEAAVRRWREAWPADEPPPFDEWSEAIGYTETRRYVKGVLGHVMRYRWVYGDPE